MLKRAPSVTLPRISARLVPATASLMGAAGVALGALAAHMDGGQNLAVASSFLLFHAPAILAIAALAPRSRPIFMAQVDLS
jgi:uncharacterized membrane protein YgdD (TMEM256/DUF423 family)